MRVIIAGDLVPTKTNLDLFVASDVKKLLGEELFLIWNSADFRIFNLEVPLTDNPDPISKCGPNLISSTNAINGIKSLNPSLVALANNHILDQGEKGLSTTCELLKSHQIDFIGIGRNLKEASLPYIFQEGSVRIGVYNCAESEFSIATDNYAGANPFDPLESLDHIASLKEQCDYVIVLYHGGKEYYRYPSLYLQKACRKMLDKGADVVICQHSHCVGSYENYNNKTIIYGQGNFIFDKSDNEYWKTSILVNLDITTSLKVAFTPIVKNGNGVRLADANEGLEILSAFESRSSQIQIDGFVESEYIKFAKRYIDNYLKSISGYAQFWLRLDRKLFNGYFLKWIYSKKRLLSILNYVECEAHRELLLAGIKERLKIERKEFIK